LNSTIIVQAQVINNV